MLQLRVCQMLLEKYSRPCNNSPKLGGNPYEKGQQVEHPVDQ
jgi:hypothetical protein